MRTLRGEAVDRPAVSFYELNALNQDPDDPDPFNIFNDPSWRPLLDLTRDRTDRIVLRGVPIRDCPPDPVYELSNVETHDQGLTRETLRTVTIGARTLTSRTRREASINTVWTTEHLLKDVDDLKAYLSVPPRAFAGTPDLDTVLSAEEEIGDTGIVAIDTADPLCMAAALFSMEDFTIIALTEQELFMRLLERFASFLHARTEAVTRALPGRLWRICGPEYASPPYLPPDLFRRYVVDFDTPMVSSIQKHGGFARIHSHGRLRDILDDIAATGCTGLDPIEPPPQGDVELRYVRKHYGEQFVLFGNLEVSDIEMLPTSLFERKVRAALEEGTTGEGRGFVLMPSACPYGRELSSLAMRNYEKIIEVVEE